MLGGVKTILGRIALSQSSASAVSRPSASVNTGRTFKATRNLQPRLPVFGPRNHLSTSTRRVKPASQLKAMSGSPFFSRSSSWEPSTGLVSPLLRRSYFNGGLAWDGGRSVRAAVWTLIALNTAVFGTWQYAVVNCDRKLQQWFQTHFTLSWANVNAGRYHTLLTSAFAHMGLGHFAFNMMTMYTFGSVISAANGIGSASLFGLAIGSALASSVAYLYHQKLNDRSPGDRNKWGPFGQHAVKVMNSALGASGVVMGMSAVATCLMPIIPMYVMFIPVAIPLWVTSCGYVALDLFYLDSAGSPIGHAAHLGGFAFGAVYYLVYLRRFGGISQLLRGIGGRRW